MSLPWASCQIRNIDGLRMRRECRERFPRHRGVSDPDMHHGTCVMHVPWCMPRSLTSGFLWSRCRVNIPGIPGACATRGFTHLARSPLGNHYWIDPTLMTQSSQNYPKQAANVGLEKYFATSPSVHVPNSYSVSLTQLKQTKQPSPQHLWK